MIAYEEKIKDVCDYILTHLDDTLNVDVLCQIAHLSKYHFHRVFTAFTGVGLMKYVQLFRLKRASYQLLWQDAKVIDIALQAGFESPEAFTRAFKRTFQQTPVAFRQSPNWSIWHQQFLFHTPKERQNMKIDIVTRPLEHIAFISHIGHPEKVAETAGQFIAWRKATGLSPVKTSATYGIPYADPEHVPAEAFRFDIAGSVSQPVPSDGHIQNGIIPAGRYAVIRHLGSHDTIKDTVYYLFRQWLPTVKEEAGDFPVFFRYLNFVHEVSEKELITDIYLLLK